MTTDKTGRGQTKPEIYLDAFDTFMLGMPVAWQTYVTHARKHAARKKIQVDEIVKFEKQLTHKTVLQCRNLLKHEQLGCLNSTIRVVVDSVDSFGGVKMLSCFVTLTELDKVLIHTRPKEPHVELFDFEYKKRIYYMDFELFCEFELEENKLTIIDRKFTFFGSGKDEDKVCPNSKLYQELVKHVNDKGIVYVRHDYSGCVVMDVW